MSAGVNNGFVAAELRLVQRKLGVIIGARDGQELAGERVGPADRVVGGHHQVVIGQRQVENRDIRGIGDAGTEVVGRQQPSADWDRVLTSSTKKRFDSPDPLLIANE